MNDYGDKCFRVNMYFLKENGEKIFLGYQEFKTKKEATLTDVAFNSLEVQGNLKEQLLDFSLEEISEEEFDKGSN